MAKSNTLENSLLLLLFNATTFADIAENDTTSPATNLYFSLHTADPGETGTMATSECAYTSYARVAVARSGGGFTVTANSVSPAAAVSFPACTGGTETATHFGVGIGSSGATVLLYRGAITPNISISTGVTPQLTTATAITES